MQHLLSNPLIKFSLPLACFVILLLLFSWRHPDWKQKLGWAPPPLKQGLSWVLVYGIWMLATNYIFHWRGPWDWGPWHRSPYLTIVLRLLAVGFVGPAEEELIFRGILLSRLSVSIPKTAAVVLLAALWAVIHVQYSPGVIVLLFCDGLFLGAARLQTRSLWTPIGMHVIWNCYAIW